MSQPQRGGVPNYMDNVMSRFGHHLSPNQRTFISESMIPTLQSAKPGSYELPYEASSAAAAAIIQPQIHSAGTTNKVINSYDSPPVVDMKT